MDARDGDRSLQALERRRPQLQRETPDVRERSRTPRIPCEMRLQERLFELGQPPVQLGGHPLAGALTMSRHCSHTTFDAEACPRVSDVNEFKCLCKGTSGQRMLGVEGEADRDQGEPDRHEHRPSC